MNALISFLNSKIAAIESESTFYRSLKSGYEGVGEEPPMWIGQILRILESQVAALQTALTNELARGLLDVDKKEVKTKGPKGPGG